MIIGRLIVLGDFPEIKLSAEFKPSCWKEIRFQPETRATPLRRGCLGCLCRFRFGRLGFVGRVGRQGRVARLRWVCSFGSCVVRDGSRQVENVDISSEGVDFNLDVRQYRKLMKEKKSGSGFEFAKENGEFGSSLFG